MIRHEPRCLAASAFVLLAWACSAPPAVIDSRSSPGLGGHLGESDGGSPSHDAASSVDTESDETAIEYSKAEPGTGGNAEPDGGTANTGGFVVGTGGGENGGGQLDAESPPEAGPPPQDAGLTGRPDGGGEGGVPGDAGGTGDGGDGASEGGVSCTPVNCGTHSWACWPMPNAAGLGLPNEASYTDLGDGTVRDNKTCLVWERVVRSSSSTYTWPDAQNRCASPQLPGTGWRLPTRIELMSIVDDSVISPATASVFTSPYEVFWTGSTVAANVQQSWTILFYNGVVATKAQSSKYYARCVRGNGDGILSAAPPPNHYSLIDGPIQRAIQDNYTNLVWQEKDSQMLSPSPMSWESAVTYCSSMTVNGSGWRLPSIKELATLVNEAPPSSRLSPTVDTAVFGSTAGASYWSSSLYNRKTPSAAAYPWTLNFRDGSTSYTESTAFAKCVR
jgi:hypothetical protein